MKHTDWQMSLVIPHGINNVHVFRCSGFESEVEWLRIMKKVWVCEECYKNLRPKQSSSKQASQTSGGHEPSFGPITKKLHVNDITEHVISFM